MRKLVQGIVDFRNRAGHRARDSRGSRWARSPTCSSLLLDSRVAINVFASTDREICSCAQPGNIVSPAAPDGSRRRRVGAAAIEFAVAS